MIFYIGNESPATGLKQVLPRLFLDDGWSNKGNIYFKGYSTECVLADSIDDILNGYQPAGKWCVIHEEKIYHPLLRGFPLFSRNDEQTNLKLDGFETVIYSKIEDPKLVDRISIEEASQRIGDILVENTLNFYKYNNPEPMTVYLSAGLDTLTCWTIQEQVSNNYDISVHLPTPQDTTFELFVGIEREYHTDVMDILAESYWGYRHPSFYRKTNWTHSGFYAETYTYRDIAALAALTKYSGLNCITELTKESDYYHLYLQRPTVMQAYKKCAENLNITDELSLRKYLWDSIWYDHQIWHLDNNMFFCPFADVRIPDIAMKLSIEDIIKISVNGDIQRNIIKRFKPDALSILSDYKNEGKIWGNFRKNFNQSMVHPDTRLIYR